jgi:uncharacterized protein (TIGR02246 family)
MGAFYTFAKGIDDPHRRTCNPILKAGKMVTAGSPEVVPMRIQLGLALCAVLFFGASARAQNPSKDERAIRAVAAHWQDNWNNHNYKALANLLASDGDYITDEGVLLEGRNQIDNWFTTEHRQMYLGSHWTNNEVTMRFLQPDIVIVYLTWAIQGDLDQKGLPRKGRPGISTWLLVKLGNGWRIRSAQDTSGQ